MNDIRICTITLTRKCTGESVTDVFSDQVEAVDWLFDVAKINKIQLHNDIKRIDDDLYEFVHGENRVSELSLKIYNIRELNYD